MVITHKDLIWNYAATFLKVASSVLLLPLILRMMPSEMIGIWTIFNTVIAFVGLLDFGFNPSFSRNITYVFSGVKSLKTQGIETINDSDKSIDYSLLKGVIEAMKWFYFRISIALFLILATLGTWYINYLMQKYSGEKTEVFVAWGLLCLINAYNIFTLYYDSLLQGKGLVKKSKQIVIIGNFVYLIAASLLLLTGKGIIALVSAQILSVIIIRWLSQRAFYTKELMQQLQSVIAFPKNEILKTIYPNAVKIGLTSLGGFMVVRSAIVIGSFNLSLNEIASYGITMQLIGIIGALAGIFTATHQPKIAQLRVTNNLSEIKTLYLKGQIVLFLTFIGSGIVLVFFGEWALELIGSKTKLMPQLLISLSIIIAFLESNHSIAGGIIMTKNEVPFFKASLLSGGVTVILLLFLFQFTNLGLMVMILSPGIAQGVYQNWKWPSVVFNELEIKKGDLTKTFIKIIKLKYQSIVLSK